MNNADALCPFSKAIIGQWCRCSYATLAERCAGKMICSHSEQHRANCHELVQQLKNNSRFILGLSNIDSDISHMQSMKIKCGGLLGMQRLLAPETDKPAIDELISKAQQQYGDLAQFPYADIVRDITCFSHRRPYRK
ncbi:MAG: hypothetical protein EP315_03075 [Gammaproteobacteria bacterium]|nr:MAG: hypothetical protein EP315_03075 [Gammaproteobacteria bacterium]